jgi:DNA mismatch repair protein MutS
MLLDDYFKLYKEYAARYGERCVLFMQVGSFYEAYSVDNIAPNLIDLADILNILYTRRDKSKSDSPYMLGFPLPSLHKYVRLLIQRNFTVVLYSQSIEDGSSDTKGLNSSFNRDLITRNLEAIYTPSTYIEDTTSNTNYMVGIHTEESGYRNEKSYHCGLTIIDISTGDLMYLEEHFKSTENLLAYLSNVNSEIQPKEYVVFKSAESDLIDTIYRQINNSGKKCTTIINNEIKKLERISYQTEFFSRLYPKCSGLGNILENLDIQNYSFARLSLVLTLDFCYQLNSRIVNFIKQPRLYHQQSLILGNQAIAQLNIIDNNNLSLLSNEYTSVYDVVNNCSTAMGKRLLYKKLISPDISPEKITNYYAISESLSSQYNEVKNILKNIKDIERLGRRIMFNNVSPSELYSYYCSIKNIFDLIKFVDTDLLTDILKYENPTKNIVNIALDKLKSFIKCLEDNFNMDLLQNYNTIRDVRENIIRNNSELRRLESCLQNDNDIYKKTSEYFSTILNEKRGAKLEIRDTKDGKHIYTTLIRGDKIEKTLIERGENDKYTFIKLNKACRIVVNDVSSDDYNTITEQFFNLLRRRYLEIIDTFEPYFEYFYIWNGIVATIDLAVNNCILQDRYGYCKPTIKKGNKIVANQLRHPLIERLIDTEYVPNDLDLNRDPHILLFGINSSGKSSLQKSLGISLILAQAGVYVPALSYVYSPYRKLFVRISGSDNIFKGQSSFVVEMTELKNILNNTGSGVLVISDEMARGSETTSSISIVASAIIELVKSGTNFISATHFKEILEFPEVKELPLSIYHLSVEVDDKGKIVYGRRLLPGVCTDNYGVMVAGSIIKSTDFLLNCERFSRRINDERQHILSTRSSNYNTDVYVDSCFKCGTTRDLHTHHLIEQSDCDKYKSKVKPHINKNSKANLLVLCNKCHQYIHSTSTTFEKVVSNEGLLIK